jgi:predicted CXXCH cytochrome family protein
VLPGLLLARPPDLCLSCHTSVGAAMDTGRVHAPAARDCLRCHTAHASDQDRLMAQPARDICAECHDVRTQTFGVAHVQIDPGIMRCERCHDAHASTEPFFFKENVHPPFAMGSCTDCHIGTALLVK